MPAETPNPDFLERAVDRAIRDVKELMGAEFRVIAAELRAIREQFQSFAEHVGRVESRVEDHESRLTAIEAIVSSQEKRNLRRYEFRIGHLPGYLLGGAAVVLGVLGFAHSVHLF